MKTPITEKLIRKLLPKIATSGTPDAADSCFVRAPRDWETLTMMLRTNRAGRRTGVERIGDAHERDAAAFEAPEQLGEV